MLTIATVTVCWPEIPTLTLTIPFLETARTVGAVPDQSTCGLTDDPQPAGSAKT